MYGGHPQHASPVAVGERHAFQLRAAHVLNAIQLGQAFVDEGVIAFDQFQQRAILADDVIKDMDNLLAHGLRQDIVILGEALDIGPLFTSQSLQLQPLQGKPFSQGRRSGIGQHASDLLSVNKRFQQLFGCGEPQEQIVRRGGPQEIGQATGQ